MISIFILYIILWSIPLQTFESKIKFLVLLFSIKEQDEKKKKRNLGIIVSKLVTHLKVTSSRIDTSITPVSSHLASISRSTSFRCSRKSSRTWTPSSSTVCRRWLRSTRWLSVHEGSPLWTWLAYPIDQPTIHTFGEGKRIGKQEGRNGKVSQDRCFFSKSRVRCPLNRNVGKVKLILSFSAYLSFLLFIFLSLCLSISLQSHRDILKFCTRGRFVKPLGKGMVRCL